MERLQNEPLTVKYNDSNNQKFLTIPSNSTGKPFSEIEPEQKVFPVAVDKRWSSEYYPEFLQALELLEKVKQLMQLTGDIAAEHERKANGDQPAEELAWLGEAMMELSNDRIEKYIRRIEDEFNLQDHDIPAERFTKAKIRMDHGQQMVEKYEELTQQEREKKDELLEEFDEITGYTSHGTEITVHLEDDQDPVVPFDYDPDVQREDVAEFVEGLVELAEERERKFREFAEELGYEHRLTEFELGFHQFTYEEFIVEVPMCLSDPEKIEIYEKDP